MSHYIVTAQQVFDPELRPKGCSVLCDNKAPAGNSPPDLVLGQKDFNTNNPGTGLNQLSWPIGVATDGKLIGVSDRIHLWNSFPQSETRKPDLSVGATPNSRGYDFGGMQAGDGSSASNF